jgi:alginate O-acetyltransferase complex protein AlgI
MRRSARRPLPRLADRRHSGKGEAKLDPMLFNSIDFAVFLPVVFLLYWFVFNRNRTLQNAFLVAASYFFYAHWDWRFLALIATSSAVDYLVGLGFARTEDATKRRLLLLTSLAVNLGFLGFFKYFNFFAESFAQAFVLFGQPVADTTRLSIVLPVGISFYTFQTLSYTIDVYRRRLEPAREPWSFFAFVSFFPQLVAGPIERATSLLPQFYSERRFDYDSAVDGLRQILWGLFKKIAIADGCAIYVNQIFASYGDYSGSTLLLGAVFFSFQIYGDFSGYSDIAIGTARLFGFRLTRNFAFPYFSRDIAEFWRRWHISLSSWFRDYIYIPLGGSRGGTSMKVRNTLAIFLLSGLWHGANWTFVVWGLLNACYFLPLLLLDRNRTHTDVPAEGRWLPGPREAMQIASTFLLTALAWVVFRADTMGDALRYLAGIFSRSLFSFPEVGSPRIAVLIGAFVLIEWLQRDKEHALQLEGVVRRPSARWAIYYATVAVIFLFGATQQQFIYFQF